MFIHERWHADVCKFIKFDAYVCMFIVSHEFKLHIVTHIGELIACMHVQTIGDELQYLSVDIFAPPHELPLLNKVAQHGGTTAKHSLQLRLGRRKDAKM